MIKTAKLFAQYKIFTKKQSFPSFLESIYNAFFALRLNFAQGLLVIFALASKISNCTGALEKLRS